VVEQDGIILGYAYGSMHRTKTAYQWSPESTIYVDKNRHGKRLGRILYQTLFSLLKMQGYVNVYAGVTVPNEKSEGLHTSLGFELIGDFKNVGFKQGKWHDVRWLVLHLVKHNDNPPPPIPMEGIRETEEFRHILAKANDALNQNHRL
jgi:L-amino acid N-acyltransferase YncA